MHVLYYFCTGSSPKSKKGSGKGKKTPEPEPEPEPQEPQGPPPPEPGSEEWEFVDQKIEEVSKKISDIILYSKGCAICHYAKGFVINIISY